MRRWLLACCAALAGCTAPVSGPFYVSAAFSPDEQQQIAMAARSWESATYDAAHIDLVFGADAEPSVGSAWSRRIIVPITAQQWRTTDLLIGGDVNEGYFAQGKNYRAIVLLTPSPVPVREVVMHEFGHSLGMRHVADSSALMFAAPDLLADRFAVGQCVSVADADELRRATDGDVRRIRTCL